MPERERSRVMAIRRGQRTFLPPRPDRAAVDRFLVDAYRRAWVWLAESPS
jgi:hypothetical protein